MEAERKKQRNQAGKGTETLEKQERLYQVNTYLRYFYMKLTQAVKYFFLCREGIRNLSGKTASIFIQAAVKE